MSSNGREIQILLKLIFIFLFPLALWADANQYLDEQIPDVKWEIEKSDEVPSHLPFNGKETKFTSPRDDEEGGHLSDEEVSKIYKNLPSRTLDTSLMPSDSETPPMEYHGPNDHQLIKSINNKGKSGFGFVYIVNSYDFEGMNNAYSKTYDNGDATKGGTLHFLFNHYLSRGHLNFSWGANAGVGFSSGKGVFKTTGNKSEARVDLWQVPMDLLLSLELPIGRLVKIFAEGGPSAMGLMQTRSDKDNGEKGARRRQIGFGYFGMGGFSLNLGQIFEKNAFNMMRDNSVSNFYLTLVMRIQNYKNFQDEITISGSSFGAGLIFEFL